MEHAEDLAVRFEVAVRFTVGGPAVTGEWSSRETAVRKFRSFVGLYGDHTTVSIILSRQSGHGQSQAMRTWTREHGETVLGS
ncbi:hypothetical protein [Streptomyces sp. 35G-GA-8]|uniref:hypothetical protein n=1 Tax=Streptomyces sp. 35G-GA-8 TaxID=2939434 RepID=UPI00201F7987|nr:hypothetical protein [Streptomyces sp. 35G-GA-8]MCL7382180.1 hypothetical protein [Streptomyces sp. 35G-GA-8]